MIPGDEVVTVPSFLKHKTILRQTTIQPNSFTLPRNVQENYVRIFVVVLVGAGACDLLLAWVPKENGAQKRQVENDWGHW